MTPAERILIVVAGALLTLLIGGALVYWIDREWRDLDARQRRRRDASRPPDPQEKPDKPPADQPPGS
jgi:hypothetical protein